MLKLAAVIVIALLAVVALVLVVANRVWSGAIDADAARLEARATKDRIAVTAEMLEALPEPVRRYLAIAGVRIGATIPRIVRLTQTGRIRSAEDAQWMQFDATQIYSTDPPAFVWKASLPSRMLPIALGRDAYLDGRGSIDIRMLSLFPLASEHGEAMHAAALMRYLNEMVLWFPAALLASDVSWRAIDDHTTEVTLADRGMSATATLFFGDDGRLANFWAIRHDIALGRSLEWETPVSAYATYGNHTLPRAGAGVWKRETGDFTYIELDIGSVTYQP